VRALGDGELIDGESIVVGGLVEVEESRLSASNRSIGAPVLDVHAVDEHPMHCAIALD
jgi:hypothetical protein